MRHRCILAALGAALIGLTVAQSLPDIASDASEDWPVFGRDDAQTRFSPLDQIDASNVKQLGLAWSAEAGSNSGEPLVLEGTLYAGGARDVRTGAVKWRGEPGPAALYEGKVFQGLADGRVAAFDAVTGAQVWTARGSGAVLALRVIKGKVIAASNSGVSAYDASAGTRVWSIDESLGSAMAYDPLSDMLYVGSRAIKPDTGNWVWRSAAARQLLLADLTIADRARPALVQVTADSVRVADRITGELIHERKMTPHERHPAAYAGLLYVPVADGLVAVDPVANSEKWRATTTTSSGVLVTSGGLLFFGDAAYNAQTGERVWREPRLGNQLGSWVSYRVAGRQYMAITAGTRLLAFALDANAPLP